MTILAVDDEEIMLDRISECIREAAPDATLLSFRSPKDAYACIQEKDVDVAFLDINMRGMDGLTLGKEIKKVSPRTNIIFCTGYGDYIYDALRDVRCSGYIMKPATTKDVKEELNNLRYASSEKSERSDNLFFQCFGDFEIFYGGKPLIFETKKSKELLAILIDKRGAMCSNQELISTLWDDDNDHTSYLKKLKKDIVNTLHGIGQEEILLKSWGGMAIVRDKIACDYYSWLQGDAEGIRAYTGSYMEQFSWAEVTKGALTYDTAPLH